MECEDIETFTGTAGEHARNPHNHGPLSDFNGHARITGPCGDTMDFWVDVRNGIVERISFVTDGCGSSMACGSMASCLAKGKPCEEAAALQQQEILAALGCLPGEFEHCALLAANTLKAACTDYLERRISLNDDKRKE
ncbi:MAG: nitrogen fixation protein NifU [Acidobacteriota bacterium]|nr:nitrogen fixation protein NifU [Acidobacteriota bacterium]